MANRDAPQRPTRPTGLSGQEEEALRTLEKGYDPDGSALPDKELPVHDDRDHKPGDGPAERAAASDDGRDSDRDSRGDEGRGRDGDHGRDRGAHPSHPSHPVQDAEKKGLVPPDTVAAPPMDRPDRDAAGPANLDPDVKTAHRTP
jgi:hypothetical protein